MLIRNPGPLKCPMGIPSSPKASAFPDVGPSSNQQRLFSGQVHYSKTLPGIKTSAKSSVQHAGR
jgi:hypothetical protein